MNLKGDIMMWRIRRANKEYTCILCGESIGVGKEYIRPPLLGLDKPVSPPHETTFGQRRPYFHVDCFKNLRTLYDPAAPVERWKDYGWEVFQI